MNNSTNKQKYREFCKTEINIPIFSKDWWLDAVCGEDNWDVAIVERGGEIWATMPYYIKRKWGFTLITMPPLTQKLGPYIKYPSGQKYYKRLSWEKEIMNELIDQLPKFDYFYQQWDYTITNWLPFYWRGFKQTTRYTYVIEKNVSLALLEKEFETAVRRRRRRKAYELGLQVAPSKDLESFYNLNRMTFDRKNMNIPYDYELVEKIYNASKMNNAVDILIAKYEDKTIAAGFFVKDNNTTYYLMGGIEPNYKDLGGMDIVMFEAIKKTLNDGKNFDFEGSMVENIEKYFRSFGSIQKPYFAVYKIDSKILKLRNCLKEVLS
jgi:lipid II:glycine glycyltransferase (peptidoglycan interpeptide bridge formation enzyme)